MNWGHQHFQCCALPTELPRQRGQPYRPTPRERAMRFELTTFSLARRRSTTELRPHIRFDLTRRPGSSWVVDPVGFEPTIFSVQGRRLPTRPRAPVCPGADERTRTSTPLRAIDPKSIASANSATSARVRQYAPHCRRITQLPQVAVAASSGGIVPPILSTDHLAANGSAGPSSVSAVSCSAEHG